MLEIWVPPDKSVTHRALLFAGLASGQSEIKDALKGADCLATIVALRNLGVAISVTTSSNEQSACDVLVDSAGFESWKNPSSKVDCENSGTTARHLLALMAAKPGLNARLTGDKSLSQRPFQRIIGPLEGIGAKLRCEKTPGRLPIRIEGTKLKPFVGNIETPSAQVKSALLMVGLFTEGKTDITLPQGTRNHTELLFTKFGIAFSQMLGKDQKTGTFFERITLNGPQHVPSFAVKIPRDPSSAAFVVVASLLGIVPFAKGVRLKSLSSSPTRLGFVRVLKRMGANIEWLKADDEESYCEPVQDLVVRPSCLIGTTILPEEVPSLIDEVPLLALAAAFAKGRSVFYGLGELKVKESNRFDLSLELLTQTGALIAPGEEENSFYIEGGLDQVRGFTFDPKLDHRMCMTAHLAARLSKEVCNISDPHCVNVSFPGFFDLFTKTSFP